VFGGLKSFDGTKRRLARVKNVMQISTGVAVVADNTWAAMEDGTRCRLPWMKARTRIRATRSASYQGRLETAGVIARKDGDADGAMAGAAKNWRHCTRCRSARDDGTDELYSGCARGWLQFTPTSFRRCAGCRREDPGLKPSRFRFTQRTSAVDLGGGLELDPIIEAVELSEGGRCACAVT
jgi:hypothetical protein